MRSIRQELLPRDARDLLAFALRRGVGPMGLPPCGFEVRIDGAVENILNGGAGYVSHALSDNDHYFKHRDDEAWAVVMDGDCDGNADRGLGLLRAADPLIARVLTKEAPDADESAAGGQ